MIELKKMKTKLRLPPEKPKTSSETKREERETEALLSINEWYRTFVQTCKGLYNQGSSQYPAVIHLIYCAILSKKFSLFTPSLHKVKSLIILLYTCTHYTI